jgi:hypothetical protein
MLPKSGLACLLAISCLSMISPLMAQSATENGVTKIASMEVKFFAHPYNSEKLATRVGRLERFVYGTESSNPSESLDERMGKLIGHVNTAMPAAKPSAMNTMSAPPIASRPAIASKPAVQTPAKYPRVTELEQEIFERNFESDAINSRIARLESKVFGRVWTQQTDLATRVDRLGEYAYVSPKVAELQRAELLRVRMLHDSSSSSAHSARPDRSAEHAPSIAFNVSTVQTQRVSYSQPAASARHGLYAQTAAFFQPITYREPQPIISVVDEIESLETMAFGKISASKPLGQRVDALEVSFCGAVRNDSQQNLTSRVALLLSKVNSCLPNRLGV